MFLKPYKYLKARIEEVTKDYEVLLEKHNLNNEAVTFRLMKGKTVPDEIKDVVLKLSCYKEVMSNSFHDMNEDHANFLNMSDDLLKFDRECSKFDAAYISSLVSQAEDSEDVSLRGVLLNLVVLSRLYSKAKFQEKALEAPEPPQVA